MSDQPKHARDAALPPHRAKDFDSHSLHIVPHCLVDLQPGAHTGAVRRKEPRDATAAMHPPPVLTVPKPPDPSCHELPSGRFKIRISAQNIGGGRAGRSAQRRHARLGKARAERPARQAPCPRGPCCTVRTLCWDLPVRQQCQLLVTKVGGACAARHLARAGRCGLVPQRCRLRRPPRVVLVGNCGQRVRYPPRVPALGLQDGGVRLQQRARVGRVGVWRAVQPLRAPPARLAPR